MAAVRLGLDDESAPECTAPRARVRFTMCSRVEAPIIVWPLLSLTGNADRCQGHAAAASAEREGV